MAVGVQRDDDLDAWKPAHDAALELNLGIFEPWHFKAYAAYSDRRQAAGGFDATRVGVVLERRF